MLASYPQKVAAIKNDDPAGFRHFKGGISAIYNAVG